MEHETRRNNWGTRGRRLLLTYYLSQAFSRLLAWKAARIMNGLVLEGKRGAGRKRSNLRIRLVSRGGGGGRRLFWVRGAPLFF